jgi:hypothetical protein
MGGGGHNATLILNLDVDGGDWSASSAGPFRVEDPRIHWTGRIILKEMS